MAIALVASRQDYADSSADGYTSGTLDSTGATLLVVGTSTVAATDTITDSKGNTWTPLTQRNAAGTRYTRIWYVENPTVGTGHTISIAGTDTFPATVFAAYSGAATSSVFDAESGDGQVFNNVVQPGSITPAEDNELFVTSFGADGGSVSINSTFVVQQDVTNSDFGHMKITYADKIQTTGGAENPTWTMTDSRTIVAAMATFKAAAAPGGGTVKAQSIRGWSWPV